MFPQFMDDKILAMTDDNVPKIKLLRLQTGLTQGELADRAGIARATMNRIEKGQRVIRKDIAMKLAPHLNTNWFDLMADDQDFVSQAEAMNEVMESLKAGVIDAEELQREIHGNDKIPVRQDIRYGLWLPNNGGIRADVDFYDKATDHRFPDFAQYIIKMSGSDAGAAVWYHCVDMAIATERGYRPKDGTMLHIERTRKVDGVTEYSADIVTVKVHERKQTMLLTGNPYTEGQFSFNDPSVTIKGIVIEETRKLF